MSLSKRVDQIFVVTRHASHSARDARYVTTTSCPVQMSEYPRTKKAMREYDRSPFFATQATLLILIGVPHSQSAHHHVTVKIHFPTSERLRSLCVRAVAASVHEGTADGD